MNFTEACSHHAEHKQDAQANTSESPRVAIEGEGGDKLLLFSRELAVDLNPEKPDINGALMLYGLYLWQRKRLKSFQYIPKVNGKRGCYRSLSELHKQYPWLSEEGIRKNLKRAELRSNGNFIVDCNNAGAKGGKLHFYLSPEWIKKYRFADSHTEDADIAKGLIGLSRSDAAAYGLIEAILKQNLNFITDPKRNSDPIVDDQGRIYRELSPTRLTTPREDSKREVKAILPASRKRVTEALSKLTACHVIKEHPTRANFYRLADASDGVLFDVPRVAESVTIVANEVTKVATTVTKVAICNERIDGNVSASNASQPVAESSISKTDSKPNSNSDRKCIFASSVSLRSTENGKGDGISAGGKRLMQLVTEELSHKRQHSLPCGACDMLEPYKIYRVIHDDQVACMGYELPYDYVALEWYTGKQYCREAEIEHFTEEVLSELRASAIPFDKRDVVALRAVLEDNPRLSSEDLLPSIGHLGAWNILAGDIPVPKAGHDFWYWSRRVKTLKSLLRYLPQVIREQYVLERYIYLGYHLDDWDGMSRPPFNYEEMPLPLLVLAFENEREVPVCQRREDDDEGESYYRPIYFREFAELPTTEHVDHQYNPIPG